MLGACPIVVAAADQAAKFEHFTIKEGLASNQTYQVLQSKQGVIWLATRQGLSKFDGSEFITYTHAPDNPKSIASNYIWTMRETPDGALWLSLFGGGLDKFDPTTETFTHYRHDDSNPNSISTNILNSSFQDSKGFVWVASDKYLDKLDPKTNNVTHYQPEPKKANGLSASVYTMLEDAQGSLWLGTYVGLNKLDPATGTITHYLHEEGNPKSLNGAYVWSLLIDSAGTLWVGTDGGLNRFDPTTASFVHYQPVAGDSTSLSGSTVTFLKEDEPGVLWVGTMDGGLNRFNTKTSRFERFQHDPANPDSLSNNTVWGVIKDTAGAYWVATENGLNRYDPQAQRFNPYQHNAAKPDSLSNNAVQDFYEDGQGVLWISTSGGGLNKFDRARGVFAHYLHDPANPNSLGQNDVRFIRPGRDGVLWLATSNGLERFDPATEKFAHYLHEEGNPNSLLNNNIWGLALDADGKLWVSSYNGDISHFDPQANTFTHFKHDASDPNSLASNSAYYFLVSSDGSVWIGCHGGLSRLDPKTQKFTNFTDKNSHLSDDIVNVVYEDSRRTIWIGTGNGLNQFDPATQTFHAYYVKDGLSGNAVSSIVEDNKGHLWIGTNGGLSRFDPQAKTLRNYDERDGLQSNQVNALGRGKGGEVFVGGVNGFNIFAPDKLTDNPHVPGVILTDFQLLNRPVAIGGDSPLQKHINVTDHLTLPYNYTVLTLKFAALNYRSPDKNQYAYMLEGFDRDWVRTASNNRLATYTNLDPGEYAFRVKASNNDGVWNDKGTTLTITITPPWWETWQFRIFVAVALLALVVGGYRLRVRSILQRSHELERQVGERTRELQIAKDAAEKAQQSAEVANGAKSVFLAHMSHELRTPLNGILGYADILAGGAGSDRSLSEGLEIIRQSGEHLLTLINDVLDLVRIEAGRIELHPAPFMLAGFLKQITGIMRARAEAKQLALTSDELSPLPAGVLADETRLRQVLLNLLGNAVKFTDHGQVSLNVEVLEYTEAEVGEPQATLRFSVKDSGPGIAPEQLQRIFEPFEQVGGINRRAEGAGLGLAISRQIVQQMGGQLQVQSTLGQGSVFWFDVVLPVIALDALEVPAPAHNIIGYEGARRSILVVDDKAYNRQVFRDLLEPVGFVVHSADDGQQAIAKAVELHPDAILMDQVMPVMSGSEAVQAIRQRSDLKEVVIIAISASVLEAEQEKTRVAGCNAFLPKPARRESLLQTLAAHLGLTWVYAEPQPAPDAPLMGPPADELRALYQFARSGRIVEIRAATQRIAALDARYQPFAERVYALSREVDIARIIALLEQFMPKEAQEGGQ
ncbi:MAG TPA: two-component regulator propeller domain-containing protein [Rhodoferax sp.]